MEIKSIGDMDFDTLYNTYADYVYQIALHYYENHHIAEEIVQEVFEEVLDYEKDIVLENAEAWFFTLARNKVRSYIRDHKKELLVESVFEHMDNIVHIEGFDNMKRNNSIEDNFIQKLTQEDRLSLIEKIYDALYEKNERWYLAMTGAYVLKVPHKVLAKKMGISLGSLEMILSRAKRWVQKQYQKEFDRLDKE